MSETTECEVCNNELDHWKITKTVDGKNICMQCYDTTCAELHKGIITLAEAIETRKFIAAYDAAIERLLLGIRKMTVKINETDNPTVRMLQAEIDREADYEEQLSIMLFRKSRNCLERAEHYVIVTQIIESENYKELFSYDLVKTSRGNSAPKPKYAVRHHDDSHQRSQEEAFKHRYFWTKAQSSMAKIIGKKFLAEVPHAN